MNRVFVIADLHFGHRKLQEIRGISDDTLVRRWNSVVGTDDLTYVLGDVFKLDRMDELNGRKRLAMGNHDRLPMKRYLEHFVRVRAMFEYDNCLLTHIPIHPLQLQRYRMNVHGHLHEHKLSDPRYVNVSAEQLDYTPTLLRNLT